MRDSDRELIDLAERYLEGTLDSRGRDDLLHLLKSDEAFRNKWLHQLDVSSLLAEHLEGRDFPVEAVERITREVPEEGTREAFLRMVSSRGRRARRRRIVRWMAAAAAAMIAVWFMVHGGWLKGRRAEGVVAARVVEAFDVSGSRLRGDGERSLTLAAGDEVREGDRLWTGPEGKITLRFGDEGTVVELSASSKLSVPVRVPSVSSDRRLRLDAGRLLAEVAKRPERNPFVVETPHARIEVLGTRFGGADRSAGHAAKPAGTCLQVEDGLVQFSLLKDREKSADVKAGQVALARAGAERVLTPGRLVRSIRLVDLAPDTHVTGIAATPDGVWIHGHREADRAPVLASFDPATGKTVSALRLREPFEEDSCLSWGQGLLWGFAPGGASLRGVDIESGETVRTISLPADETSSTRIFDIRGNAGWLRGKTRNEIVKIDLETGAVLAKIACPFAVDRITTSETAVYAGESGWNACKLDPRDERVAYRFLCGAGSVTGDMTIGEDLFLWTVQGDAPIVHIIEAE
jgi:ferric-dicitrate binding protein FerR (iron transport regulator)